MRTPDQGNGDGEHHCVGGDVEDGLHVVVVDVGRALGVRDGHGPVAGEGAAPDGEVADFDGDVADDDVDGDGFNVFLFLEVLAGLELVS